jgi:hypothetical protein
VSRLDPGVDWSRSPQAVGGAYETLQPVASIAELLGWLVSSGVGVLSQFSVRGSIDQDSVCESIGRNRLACGLKSTTHSRGGYMLSNGGHGICNAEHFVELDR